VKHHLRRVFFGALAFAGASSFVGHASAQEATDWADIEGRVQYAYYTNDARALSGLLAALKPKAEEGEKESSEDLVMRSYFRALTQYRTAQVLAPTKKGAAKDAIDECHDEVDNGVSALPKVPLGLDETDENRKKRVELYALVTACTLAGREMSSMPFFGGGRIGSRIDEAVKLEPRNPRVRLVEALAQFDRAGKDEKEKAAALAKLRNVTQMFEAARAGASSTPEWGAAEAYAFLGRALFDQRDVVGAREALERSLLIAPDYAFSRKLMNQITR
jgi:tetratricopeptide (TPR) repeat protein